MIRRYLGDTTSIETPYRDGLTVGQTTGTVAQQVEPPTVEEPSTPRIPAVDLPVVVAPGSVAPPVSTGLPVTDAPATAPPVVTPGSSRPLDETPEPVQQTTAPVILPEAPITTGSFQTASPITDAPAVAPPTTVTPSPGRGIDLEDVNASRRPSEMKWLLCVLVEVF